MFFSVYNVLMLKYCQIAIVVSNNIKYNYKIIGKYRINILKSSIQIFLLLIKHSRYIHFDFIMANLNSDFYHVYLIKIYILF